MESNALYSLIFNYLHNPNISIDVPQIPWYPTLRWGCEKINKHYNNTITYFFKGGKCMDINTT